MIQMYVIYSNVCYLFKLFSSKKTLGNIYIYNGSFRTTITSTK